MRRERLVPLMRIIAAAGFLVGIAAFLWLGVGSQSSTPVSAATFQIQVGDFWFCNSLFKGETCVREVAVGDSVTWLFEPTSFIHTTTECTGSCGSAIGDPDSRLWHRVSTASDTFERTFDTQGTFEYQCNIHPSQMRGTIIVGGGAPPAPSVTATPVATVAASPSPAPSVTATPVATVAASPSPTLSASATPVPTSTDVPEPTAIPPGLLGDVNGDGLINPIDAALILQFSAGMLPVLPSFERGDVNRDETVNAVDAALILQFSAGLLTAL